MIRYTSHIGKAFGLKKVYDGPYVGMELEYENSDFYVAVDAATEMSRWRVEEDHSLRNGGVEFISKPMLPRYVPAALEQVKVAMDASGAKATKRCGVHVHLNVSDLTFEDMWKLTVYYTLIEPFIFKEFADGRETSHFCTPMWANTNLQQQMYADATSLYRGISPLSTTQQKLHASLPVHMRSKNARVPLKLLGNAKYSALNFTPLSTFGTLEFRQHPATVSMAKIQRWVDFLVLLREEALRFDTPASLVNELTSYGFGSLCGRLNLPQNPEVHPLDIEDAVDAATLIVGHPPTDPHTLQWEIK